MKKLLVVASGGGHWIQLMRLKPVFDDFDSVYVSTYDSIGNDKYYKVPDANFTSKIECIKLFLKILMIVIKVRPDVIISTGAAPGFFAILSGYIFRKKTIWIDSMANVDELSKSGKYCKYFATVWLTQWEELSHNEGPYFKGRVI